MKRRSFIQSCVAIAVIPYNLVKDAVAKTVGVKTQTLGELAVKNTKKLIPKMTLNDLERGGSGVRAQLVTRGGRLYDDFLVHRSDGQTFVLNAPSPGATSSLAIGDMVTENVLESLA